MSANQGLGLAGFHCTIDLWRSSPNVRLRDYRMTRRAFGVSSSLFVANVCVKQNAIDYASQYFLATMVVDLSFYVDYCLCVADSVENAIDRFSSFTILTRVTAWILRLIHNCCVPNEQNVSPTLTVQELIAVEEYLVRFSHANHFIDDIMALQDRKELSLSSPLIPLHPFLDSKNVLHVGSREYYSRRLFSNQHPAILKGSHHITGLIIHTEHVRLLHAGPTLLSASLFYPFHIIGCRITVCSVTHGCVTC